MRIEFSYEKDVVVHDEAECKHPISVACRLLSENDEVIVGVGISSCSKEDQFSYKIGRKLALKRAIDNSGISKPERKAVWGKYFKLTKEEFKG